MAERNLSVRLAVIDGGKVKAELQDIGESGARSLKRIEDAARPASRALQALDGAAGDIRGSLEGLASRLGPLGTALIRLGPAGLAAGAAIGGLGLILMRSMQEAAEADRSYRRLEAVLRAAGFASGLTARQIADFAEQMEASTLASAESVEDAAAVLATFRSVSGETFTRALRLAQDLAAVFGQDLRASATQLGKALEEPVQGLSALRRVGVSFTASQRDLIQSLVETGQT
ncbi:MAG: phage tail length tape measure family protein, partial [Rhodospirillaceae bacterium]|nr:phage tail length tape measure family protein [Rhodospirillaceae bacterium]